MTARIQDPDRAIIKRYTNQPDGIPRSLRDEIERRWQGRPIQLYALADLNASMNLCETWIALGPQEIAIARTREGQELEITSFRRSQIRDVRLTPALSCNTFTVLGEPDLPAMMRVRFTHRQRRAMENLQFVLEQQLEGREIPAEDPDAVYAESVAGPIRDAQALVAGNDMAVLWRLLGYLSPYRGQVAFGMAAAALLTGLSLIPPYLTGYLLDEVIRPVQDGTLTLGQASPTAWLIVGVIAGVHVLRQICAWAATRPFRGLAGRPCRRRESLPPPRPECGTQ